MNSPRKPFPLQTFLGLVLGVTACGLIVSKLCFEGTSEYPESPAAAETADINPDQSPIKRKHALRTKSPASSLTDSLSSTADAKSAFLASREKLMQDREKLMRSLALATAEERQTAMEQWQEENSEAIAAQQELAVRMGAESRPPHMHVPEKPYIPESATPELRGLLTARHAVMKSQAEINNQLHEASPEERHQAMEKWHEDNAHLIDAMHAAAAIHTESLPPPAVSHLRQNQ